MPLLVADDLSGALEAGAAFHQSGWKPRLFLGNRYSSPGGAADLLVVSTETREAAPAEARERVRITLAAAKSAAEHLLYKKIDSTMRGPVGAELEAVLEAEPEASIIFTPANPLAGRTVRDGVLRVHGAPLAESRFRDDPTSPARESIVSRIISRTARLATVEVTLAEVREPEPSWPLNLISAAASGRRLALCDAESAADLEIIVKTARATLPAPLFVGSGALAWAVGAAYAEEAGPHRANPPLLPMPCLFVCGSRHPSSHGQIANTGAPLFRPGHAAGEAELVLSLAEAIDQGGCACLAATMDAGRPGEIAAALGRIIRRLDRRRALGTLVITGGETARAVCEALGADRLEICGQIEPGMAISEMRTPQGRRLLVTKPGGFGDEKAFWRVRQRLAL
jgi:uncharacterized protein YgbK (DUF1537 family)